MNRSRRNMSNLLSTVGGIFLGGLAGMVAGYFLAHAVSPAPPNSPDWDYIQWGIYSIEWAITHGKFLLLGGGLGSALGGILSYVLTLRSAQQSPGP